MPNFDNRQSATRKTPDPSTRAWCGDINGTFMVGDSELIFTPDRPFSLKGHPLCTAHDADGELLATCNNAETDGATITLGFDAGIEDAATLMFPDKDPAIRGFQAQYVTSAAIPLGEEPPPALILQEAEYDALNTELKLIWSRPVTLIAWGTSYMINNDGDKLESEALLSGDGTDTLIFQMAFVSGGNIPEMTCTIDAGAFEAVDDSEPNLLITDFPVTPE